MLQRKLFDRPIHFVLEVELVQNVQSNESLETLFAEENSIDNSPKNLVPGYSFLLVIQYPRHPTSVIRTCLAETLLYSSIHWNLDFYEISAFWDTFSLQRRPKLLHIIPKLLSSVTDHEEAYFWVLFLL